MGIFITPFLFTIYVILLVTLFIGLVRTTRHLNKAEEKIETTSELANHYRNQYIVTKIERDILKEEQYEAKLQETKEKAEAYFEGK